MATRKKMRFRTELILLFLIIGLLPVAILGYLNYQQAAEVLESQVINQLISLREDRKAQLQNFFRQLRIDAEILSDHRLLKDILADYIKAYEKGGFEGEEFKAVDARYHGRCVGLNEKYGYEGMLLADNDGEVLVTVRKDAARGTNLLSGIYSNTNLAECFKNAKEGISIVDFEEYPPDGRPAAFIGAPMIRHEERRGFKKEEMMGVLIIRIPVDQINAITMREEGFGETGETYLIGRDLLMRSGSRFLKENFILKTERKGFKGNIEGGLGYRERVIDYRGQPVSIAYAPAGIEGLDWFIEAKKDLNEIRKPLNRLRDQSLLIGLLVAIGVVLANFLFVVGIIKPLRRIREAAHKIASGDFGIRLPVDTKGEIGWLSESVNNMAVSLKKSREDLEKYSHSLEEKVAVRTEELNNKNQALGESNHIQRAHNEIVTALNSELELEPLLNSIIGKIARHTDSQLGVIYLHEEESKTLRPVSSYAIDRERLGEGFALGHGLPGQAGQEKRAILVTEVPDHYFRISSGGIEGMPKNVLCMPITFKDQLMGVLELAGIHDYGEKVIRFLDVAGYQLGIGINNALTYLRLEDMAGDLKEKNEFLAAQNEELQAQGEELQAQGEELQAQAEELMSQKNALEEKTEQVTVSDRLKSEFVSNMSHELRTPLNVLLGLTNLMAEGNTGAINEKQKEYLEIIERNGKNLLQLINDVLDLSRIESGKMDLSMSKIQLKEFIQGVSSAIMPLVEKKNLPLKVNVDENIVMYADADKLRQILVNLLGNAAKFTDKGDISIRAGVEVGRVHDHVIIEVKDTGIGIPHDALEHIFDPFRQVDGSSTREHEGTGLGLNICTKLVNLMGGKIEVESEQGKGSTFTLTLNKDRRSRLRPAQDEWQKKVRDALLQEDEAVEKRPEAKEKETRNILIVDDDPVVIRELKIIFKEKDYRISFALTGSEGLRRIRAEVPDLILLDLRMPGMDGFKVLEELQKSEEIKSVPVMIITAADLSKLEARALGKNVKDVITKGRIDKSDLLGRIDDILYIVRDGVRTGDQVAEKAEKKATGKGPAKILIAEDRPDNMTLIKETLRPTGYKVYTASNGKEAVETAKKEKPDLILMDMQMPVMSGFDATRHIREIEELKEVPIIALTARAMKGNEEEVLAAGCSDYLPKPMMPKDLAGKVEAWLGK